jgi:hypothetical protein
MANQSPKIPTLYGDAPTYFKGFPQHAPILSMRNNRSLTKLKKQSWILTPPTYPFRQSQSRSMQPFCPPMAQNFKQPKKPPNLNKQQGFTQGIPRHCHDNPE